MEKENNNNNISNGKIKTSKTGKKANQIKKTVLIIVIFIIVLAAAVFIIINFPSRKNSNIINNDLSDNDNTQNDTINNNNSNSCKYDTGIKEYDEELYDYYIKEGVCWGSTVYLNKEQLENYGFGKKTDLNNLDDFTNHVVDLLHEGASFDDNTQIDDAFLFNLLSQYLNGGNCGWYKKSLYVDAYKYIFGEKEYDINLLLEKHGTAETDNFKYLCNGIGSVIVAHLNNKKNEENKIVYEYDARFYPFENNDDYTVIVEYKKSGNNYHLNKISIIKKK